MSSPTVLITGGCSYSQIQGQDQSWPLHLQELPSIRYVSHTGHGAGGNQIISRKIISTVMKAIELGHKPEDILVGVMWQHVIDSHITAQNLIKTTHELLS